MMATLEFGSGGTGEEFELPPPGIYKIKYLGDVQTLMFPKTDKNKNPILDEWGKTVMEPTYQLQFVIDDEEDDYDGTEFRDLYPKKATPGNKTGRLFCALWGVTTQEMASLPTDTDDFIGKRCDASLIHSVSKKNGNTYLKIDSATPLKKKRRPSLPMVDAEPIEYDEDAPNF